MELGVLDPIASRIVSRTLHESRFALHARDRSRDLRQSEREVAEAAKKVEDHGVRSGIRQFDGAGHQGFVDRAVDLDEVGRLELDLQTEPWKPIEQWPRSAVELV